MLGQLIITNSLEYTPFCLVFMTCICLRKGVAKFIGEFVVGFHHHLLCPLGKCDGERSFRTYGNF